MSKPSNIERIRKEWLQDDVMEMSKIDPQQYLHKAKTDIILLLDAIDTLVEQHLQQFNTVKALDALIDKIERESR